MGLTSEHGVLAIGLLLACASATFAIEKIASNTGVPSLPAVLPKGELMAWKRGVPGVRILQPDLEPTTTGALPRRASAVEPAGASDAAGEPSGPAPSSPDYVVVDVADGSAVIQGLGGVRQIRLGAVVPGIGRVTAIERIGTEWVILGSGGVIRERR
jgi:hypothetical protein